MRFDDYRNARDALRLHRGSDDMRPALSGVWAANALLQGWRNLDGEERKPKQEPAPGFEALLQKKEKEIEGRNQNGRTENDH